MIPLIGAHDFPYLFPSQSASQFSWPLTWSVQSQDSLGVFTLSTLWNWPYGLLYGFAGKIGLPFSVTTWIFGILPVFVLGFVSLGKLLTGYGLSKPAKLVGQLFFVANTYILMLIDGGQLSLAVAYALLPLVLLNLKSTKRFILTAAAISFLDIRYLYLLFILLGFYFLFDLKNIFRYLVTGFLTGLVLIGLHSYWILPSLFSKGPSLPSTYTRVAQVSALSFATLAHALLVIHPHWPQNIFGQVSLPSPYFAVLPILAFFPLFVLKKNKTVAFWSLLTVISVFLVKASNPPFPDIYGWLFSHLPGFSLFRDPTKFFPLEILGFSVLIAYSIDCLVRFKKIWWIFPIYLALLIVPVFTQATGLFSWARDQEPYQHLAGFLATDSSSGGILWIPSKPPLGFGSPDHPSMDALTLLDKRPFVTGVVGTYDLMNFIRDASYSGQLLDVSAVKYLAIPSLDPKRDSLKKEDISYHSIFSHQLALLPWVRQILHFGQIDLLETKSHQPLFFMPPSTTFVVGSDDLYSSGVNLSQNGLVFVEDQPGMLSRIHDFPGAKVILHHRTNLDAAAAFIPKARFFFPDSLLDFSPNSTGWWKREAADIVSWRDFLQQKYDLDNQDFGYGGGWSISEGRHTLQVSPRLSCIGSCVLLARVMFSPRGGQITFTSHDQSIGQVNTLSTDLGLVERKITGYQNTPDQVFYYHRSDFLWKEVGLTTGNSPINISTEGDINVVNSLVEIPQSVWAGYQSQAQGLTSSDQSPVSNSSHISYHQISPNHYLISVDHLDHSGLLVFGQNYDPFWRLSGSSPVPVYSLLNGFPITKTGNYDLSFIPQHYVIPGLLISLATAIIFLSTFAIRL